MFDNIGGKIKALAKVLCWIGIVLFVISGIVTMLQEQSDQAVLAGILTIIVGCLLSWIGSFFAYGFGQLIENTDELVRLKRADKREE